MNFDIDAITTAVMLYAPKILIAILTLIIGFWVIKKVVNYLKKGIANKFDPTLTNFITSIISVGLKVLLLFSVASSVGFDTTSFVAILAALMVGIGMALNGTIGHFASGVLLMVFQYFKVGDLVEIGGGKVGVVESINAFNTTLSTLDNKRVIITNSNVTGNTITNISGQGIIGVEMTFGIGYGDDIDKARRLILEVGEKCPTVINEPVQGVVVAELADSSVNLATRPFCKSEDYWSTLFYMQEHVKKAFDANGISIPFPQRDIHMISNS